MQRNGMGVRPCILEDPGRASGLQLNPWSCHEYPHYQDELYQYLN